MARIGNRAVFLLDADASPGINPPLGGIALVKGTLIFYFHISGTTWSRIDIGSLSAADGNDTPVVRGNSSTGSSPTAIEVPNPESGDTASVYLTDGKLEKWVYSTAWSLAYTLQGDKASNLAYADSTGVVSNSNGTGFTIPSATAAIKGLLEPSEKNKITFISVTKAINLDTIDDERVDLRNLTGTALGADTLATFTGSTIVDNSTIKVALQALETALESISVYISSKADTSSVALSVAGGQLTANVKRSATQDNHLILEDASDGLKIVKNNSLPAYQTWQEATDDGGLPSGSSYILNADNIEGVVSDGTSGPVFVKS